MSEHGNRRILRLTAVAPPLKMGSMLLLDSDPAFGAPDMEAPVDLETTAPNVGFLIDHALAEGETE